MKKHTSSPWLTAMLVLALAVILAPGSSFADPPRNSMRLADDAGTFIPAPDYHRDELPPEYAANPPTYTRGDTYAEDEVIIRFRPNVPIEQQNALMAAHGMRFGRPIYGETAFVAKVPVGSAATIANALRNNSLLELASVNHVVKAFHDDGNDPLIGGNRVGSIGLDPKKDQALGATGAHVGGIATVRTNNSTGVAGAGYTAWPMSLQILRDTEDVTCGTYGFISDGVNAVNWATTHGASVINISWSCSSLYCPPTSGDIQLLKAAVDKAYDRGITLVAAAGNDGNTIPNYPAAFGQVPTDPWPLQPELVIAVGGSWRDSRYRDPSNPNHGSSYGPWIDLVAPYMEEGERGTYNSVPTKQGVGCRSKTNYSRTETWGGSSSPNIGTSFSASMVSGLADLLRSMGYSSGDVWQTITSGARDLNCDGDIPCPGYDIYTGYGLEDMNASMQMAVRTAPANVVVPMQGKAGVQWFNIQGSGLTPNGNGDSRVQAGNNIPGSLPGTPGNPPSTFVDTGEWTQYASSDGAHDILPTTSAVWALNKGLIKWQTSGVVTYTRYLRANAIREHSGVADNSVSSVVEDGTGGVWVGTQRGLSHFTGTEWVTYTVTNSGLVHPVIYGLARAQDGTVWIATAGGANHFDPVNNTWQTYTHENSGLPYDRLSKVAVDGTGMVWITDYVGAHLTSFDGVNWHTYVPQDLGLHPYGYINSMALDPQGRLAVGAYPGIARHDGQGWTVIDLERLALDLTYDPSGNLWIANGPWVDSYDGTTWTRYDPPDPGPNRATYLLTIAAGPDGLIWVGSYVGFYSYDPATRIWRTFRHSSFPDAMPGGSSWMLVDKQGYPWFLIGTLAGYGGGLAKLDPETNLWTKYTAQNSGLITNTLTGLALDRQDNFWITTQLGLQKFDGTTWTTYTTGNSCLPSNLVGGVIADTAGNTWFRSFQDDRWGTPLGVTRFDGQTCVTYNTQNSPLPTNYVEALWADPHGPVWFGGLGFIVRFDGQDWRVWLHGQDGWQGGVIGRVKFDYDRNGKLWVGGSLQNGLRSWDGITWTRYITANSGILGDATSSVQVDHTGIEKWVGTLADYPDQYNRTRGGVSVFNDEEWRSYTPDNSPLSHILPQDLAFDCRSAWILEGVVSRVKVSPFSDVSMSDYFFTPVQELYCKAVISGYGDGTFRPGNLTTRGQLCKIVTLAEGWDLYTPPSSTFRDVPATDPFYAYVETAYNHGVISGYNCGSGCLEFRPGNNVTRGQLCKIVVLAEGWPPYTPQAPTFRDVAPGEPFYEHIETAYHHGIISGYNCGTGCLEFRPGNNATRGQISKIVYYAVFVQ